jgi:hypothetical protein
LFEEQTVFNSLLNSFFDFTAAKITGADPNAFGLTANQDANRLEMGLEDSLRLVIGVTNGMAGLTTFVDIRVRM